MPRTLTIAIGSVGAQEAVALTPADGEILSGGVQSNWAGNGWATRNGFTRARDVPITAPDSSTLDGFDDVNFVPISIWAATFSQVSGEWDTVDDVAVNGFLPASGAVVLDTAVARGKWVTVPIDDWPAGTIPSDEDVCVVGVIPGEEPDSTLIYETHINDGDAWLDSAEGAGRFLHYNYADPLVNGELANYYFPDDMVLCRTDTQPARAAFITMDIYWFAGAFTDGGNTFKLFTRLYLDEFENAPATNAQTARGSHYGSCMDAIRKAYPAGQPGWFLNWIEAAAPYGEAASHAITAPQLEWAVWSTLVHGARGIAYFVHNFRAGDTWGSPPWDDHFGAPGVTGTGIYAAMKEVNERAMALAPVLNSPLDGYLCFGDGLQDYEQTGFLTACTSTNARGMFSGIDASCRWHPTEQKHYILAATREQDGTTNWPVTFRMVDQGQTTAVEVHESNSISVSRGGAIPEGFCEFSDTFATAASYKAYRID